MQTRIVGVMQNPVKDKMQVQIVSASQQQGHAILSDIQGRVLAQQNTSLSNGLNHWSIPVSYLAPGAYFLRVSTADGVWKTLRFVKE